MYFSISIQKFIYLNDKSLKHYDKKPFCCNFSISHTFVQKANNKIGHSLIKYFI